MVSPAPWRNNLALRTSRPLTERASNRIAAISWMDLSWNLGNSPALLWRSCGVVSASQMLAVAVRRTTLELTACETAGGGADEALPKERRRSSASICPAARVFIVSRPAIPLASAFCRQLHAPELLAPPDARRRIRSNDKPYD